jgi:8-oxo-dGTP pyrophosphatase MutT (NUDIX family)
MRSSSAADFKDFESFRRALAARLAEPLPGAEAQWRFSPLPTRKGWRPELQPPEARPAAALLLIYPGESGPVVPLTIRHSELPQHAGQISLPGGRIAAGESAETAALRETHEEIGVVPDNVRVLGRLSSLWVVVSNHLLHPFVGVLERRPAFRLAPREVDSLLEVPVSFLRDASRLGWSRHSREGVIVDYPHFDIDGHLVWGATAMVLGEFACLFDHGYAPPPRPTTGSGLYS